AVPVGVGELTVAYAAVQRAHCRSEGGHVRGEIELGQADDVRVARQVRVVALPDAVTPRVVGRAEAVEPRVEDVDRDAGEGGLRAVHQERIALRRGRRVLLTREAALRKLVRARQADRVERVGR